MNGQQRSVGGAPGTAISIIPMRAAREAPSRRLTGMELAVIITGRYAMLRLLSMLALAVLAITNASATNYYLSPTGSNGSNGLSPSTPWATLQYARGFSPALGAGDTLFIMGGRYETAQYWHDEIGARRGSAGNPLVFKAYGDGVATFLTTGPHPDGRWYYTYFMFNHGNCDHIVVDGHGYRSGAPYMLRLEGHDARLSDGMGSARLVSFAGSSTNSLEYGVARGLEVMGGTETSKDAIGISMEYCRYGIVENNYVHHIHRPTGPIPPGDGTERVQGAGYGIWISSTELTLIQGNRVERCNHGAIELQMVRPSGALSRYNRVVNNHIEQHYGGGIYLPFNTHHNLIEGNIITRCGETTDFAKPGIQISGSNNTVRKNVIFNPSNQAIRIEANPVIGYNFIANNNYIYNNTVFGSRYSLGTTVNNSSSPDCSIENCIIANNIFYASVGVLEDSSNRAVELGFDTYWANALHNWCANDGSCANCLAHETHWGGNVFHNNCIRRNDQGASYSRLVTWARSSQCVGSYVDFSLNDLQSADPVAWANNTGANPLLASENPDQYGLFNGWWHLRSASPCINAGIPVNDAIGAYVESQYPGYGWRNLGYAGSVPDIGAFEVGGEAPAPPIAPHLRISPTNR